MLGRRLASLGFSLAAIVAAGCGLDTIADGPLGVLLLAPSDADPATERLVEQTAEYLQTIAGGPPVIVRSGSGSFNDVEGEARDRGAGLVFVFEADRVAADRIGEPRMDRLGEWGFALQAEDSGAWPNRLGSEGATFVLMAGASTLAKQYASYESLRRMGVRFYHPEHEHVPEHALADLRDLARRPTVLQRDGSDDYRPDFQWRSWSFHGAHPLEHLESFSDAAHPIDEARHVNEWIVKNFGNRFRGSGRGVADEASLQQRKDELEAMRIELGFPRGSGITLHNQQQGANADIDPSSGTPVRQQIEDLVTARLQEVPDARWFGIHFGPTEFTTTPDVETVDWINWAGARALALSPDIQVEINDHITGAQPSPNFGDLGCPSGTNDSGRIDYYDLAFHTDPRLGVRVHTVMFYPLEGPARVYNQESFAHKRCLMEHASAQGRPLGWFPESAWWLSFDNPIPVYLPLHVWTRWRDVDLLKPLLASRGEGTLTDHRMFNTGQEWGYWQQDYTAGLLAFNADLTPDQLWADLLEPMCEASEWRDGCSVRDEVQSIVTALVEHQRDLFLERDDFRGRPGGLYAYFAGEDDADLLAAAAGFEFRPVRVSFAEVMQWDQAQITQFRNTDLAAINDSVLFHAMLRDRTYDARPFVAEGGLPWFDEIADGIEINEMRARQISTLYNAVLTVREEQLAEHENAELAGENHYASAQMVLNQAELAIRRREAAYRYPAAQTHGGGLTADTAVNNGTSYPFRVHTKTNLLTYWRNRDAQVRAILDGNLGSDPDAVQLREAIDEPGTALTVVWPATGSVGGSIRIGDDLVIGPSTTMVDLGPDAGWFAVAGEVSVDNPFIDARGGVARSSVRAMTPAHGLTLLDPDDATAQAALAGAFPAMEWAWLSDPPAMVFATDPEADGSVVFSDVVRAGVVSMRGSAFTTEPVAFAIPLASGAMQVDVGLFDVVMAGTIDRNEITGPVVAAGDISVADLVQALFVIAGFDEQGSLSLLARIFDFDAEDPPATVRFEAAFTITPRDR